MSLRTASIPAGLALSCVAFAAAAAGTSRAEFGKLPDGRRVEAITLQGDQGITAVVINYGAALQSLVMPDRNGRREDVTLGYASLDGYLAKPEYFGATVGRFANRLAGGKFTLDGKQYQTPQNNNGNALHGGDKGFDKVLWDVVATGTGNEASVTLRYVSPDGDQGYPGTLTAVAKYSLKGNELQIEYRATTDRPTIVNITNHAYWNLAGDGSPQGAMGHVLTIPADGYTPVDAGLIPTGEITPVAGTAFDFRQPMAIGARVRNDDPQIVIGRGYDHNFVIARDVAREPRLLARVEEPTSGRGFELWSNQPGLQFYSGNFLDATVIGKSRRAYRQGDAIAVEPQIFPDTPNRPSFGSARLAPGETYRNVIVYRFFSGKAQPR
ncbi:MAG TPA: aldose epimerase family protein [Povalibacter sp.]|mgnify:CR=1 FL=1|uniref:aldose epimerase family protein n=1 Tax=Povalibacter sp. TaxID=1962978 RepID=UPI002BB52EFA|nr:aldose epimerase family protein [Povalibacter sp.]HMN46121.1 aldose epimerase family protein [Povalibacter sp.]